VDLRDLREFSPYRLARSIRASDQTSYRPGVTPVWAPFADGPVPPSPTA
jgi:hypothetical protein